MFDFSHEFFKPLWVRIITILVCLGWGSYEFATEAPFWGTIFCGMGLLAVHQFFFAGHKY